MNTARIVAIASVFMVLGVWAVSRQLDPPPELVSFSGATMGTRYSVKSPNLELDWDTIALSVERELERINGLMSTWIPDSELSRFNRSRSTDWIALSPDTHRVLAESIAMADLSDGALDITVGPLVDLWGFGPGRGNDGPTVVPDPDKLERLSELVGYHQLELRDSPPAARKSNPELQVDLSAVAKGFAVDRLTEMLTDAGAVDFLVDIGGELRAAGSKADGQPWRIAVEKPDSSARLPQQVYPLVETGVATSGDYRNYFERDGQRYSHLIDPRSGRPVPQTLASLTVFDRSTMRADALATAMLVMGAEEALAFAETHQVPCLAILRSPEGLLVGRESSALRRLSGGQP
ncbi:MAG: FAD:protein FMN transferase [Xanthomonadales bacterium]|nr:FAD:protein FMN transferase [Xanthomonadales bacterium]